MKLDCIWMLVAVHLTLPLLLLLNPAPPTSSKKTVKPFGSPTQHPPPISDRPPLAQAAAAFAASGAAATAAESAAGAALGADGTKAGARQSASSERSNAPPLEPAIFGVQIEMPLRTRAKNASPGRHALALEVASEWQVRESLIPQTCWFVQIRRALTVFGAWKIPLTAFLERKALAKFHQPLKSSLRQTHILRILLWFAHKRTFPFNNHLYCTPQPKRSKLSVHKCLTKIKVVIEEKKHPNLCYQA